MYYLNFLGNKYCTVIFVSLPKVVSHKESSEAMSAIPETPTA